MCGGTYGNSRESSLCQKIEHPQKLSRRLNHNFKAEYCASYPKTCSACRSKIPNFRGQDVPKYHETLLFLFSRMILNMNSCNFCMHNQQFFFAFHICLAQNVCCFLQKNAMWSPHPIIPSQSSIGPEEHLQAPIRSRFLLC